jgi:hypothetical protein
MLGEYGSHDDPAMGSKEQWLRELPATLRTAMPKVKAVVYFDRLATRSRATRASGWPTAPRSPGPVSRRLGRIRT